MKSPRMRNENIDLNRVNVEGKFLLEVIRGQKGLQFHSWILRLTALMIYEKQGEGEAIDTLMIHESAGTKRSQRGERGNIILLNLLLCLLLRNLW